MDTYRYFYTYTAQKKTKKPHTNGFSFFAYIMLQCRNLSKEYSTLVQREKTTQHGYQTRTRQFPNAFHGRKEKQINNDRRILVWLLITTLSHNLQTTEISVHRIFLLQNI